MNFRNQRLFGLIKEQILYVANPKNLAKIFYRPQRLGTYISENFSAAKEIFSDTKFKSASPAELLSIETASVWALATLADNLNTKPLEEQTIESVFGEQVSRDEDCIRLASLFQQHGSDKAEVHNYYLVYASILKKKKALPLNILEIGLGTNNIDVPSNMGNMGKPGASLRAFRDMYPSAQIVGADIDTRILFEEERIKTYFVDQTKPEVLQQFQQQLDGLKFDLIIDDGLHNSEANLNTLNFALGLLKTDGIFIIEDIDPKTLPYYKVVATLLNDRFRVHFFRTKVAGMCVFIPLNAA